MKERLELSVERLSDPSEEVRTLALELLRKEIREATRYVGNPMHSVACFLILPMWLFLTISICRQFHDIGTEASEILDTTLEYFANTFY